ncbi:MAG: flagellin B [Campylobacterales bacterium]|nr:flagellin B [Campylobacterales bacterium]
MGFLKINSNIASMNSLVNSKVTNRSLDSSLEKLSSGLRINRAADDSSGMAIADSLRAQASGLRQASRNANDAIGIIQIADKAMDEQIQIATTIKTKAIQAAQDGQNTKSRTSIQRDIARLIEQLDNIAVQTSFNGMKLLAGSFINKEFQVGAFSNETIKATIGSTLSTKIGGVRFETTGTLTAAVESTLTFKNPTGGADIQIESVVISTSANSGMGQLANAINKVSDQIGVRAKATVMSTGTTAVQPGDVKGLTINGIYVGDVDNVLANDKNGNLVNAINSQKLLTGVTASVDVMGRLTLVSDGRGMKVTTSAGGGATMMMGDLSGAGHENYGRLTLLQSSSRDIKYTATGAMSNVINSAGAQDYANLADVGGNFTSSQGLAAGAYENSVTSADAGPYLGVGVTTRAGAMMTMDIAESTITMLDETRADLGAAQQQLEVTIRNIQNAEVNVKNAESTIRDLDFAEESANFSKQNILAQSGSFAMSQANSVQQNVLKLLQ